MCVCVCVCVSNRFAQFNTDKEGNIKTIQDLEEVCIPHAACIICLCVLYFIYCLLLLNSDC